MKIDMSIDGADEAITMLEKLPPEVASKNGGPVRAALRKGAQVIQKPAIENLRAATANGNTSSGLLAENVIVSRGKAPTGTKGERALVRVRRKVYPGRSGASTGGNPTTTLASAQMLEYGTSQQPMEPWLRPAFTSHARQAITTATRELVPAIDRAAKRHLKKTGGK